MGTGFAKRKKQAKMLQNQYSELQAKLQETESVGSAGNGLVTVTLTGSRELKQIKIKPECVDPEDVEGLEDLIKAAFKQAIEANENQAEMPKLPGNMPDLKSFGL